MPGLNNNINKLPLMPEVLLKLVKTCFAFQFDSEDISAILLHDPVLVACILGTRSVEPRPARLDRVTLQEMVSGIGGASLGSVASAMAVNQFYSRFWSGSDQHLFAWSRSLQCACLAGALAQATGYDDPTEAYLGGLLHNLGELLLLGERAEQYTAFLREGRSREERRAFEKKHFGSSSVEIAASLTLAWTRDAMLSDAILFQDRDTAAVLDSPELIKLVNLSCKLVSAEPWEDKSLFEDVFQSVGLGSGELLEIKSAAKGEAHELISSYGLLVDEQGNVDRTRGARKALSEHVCDMALVGSVDIVDSADPWREAIRQFEAIFDVTRTVAFDCCAAAGKLQAAAVGPGGDIERLRRVEIRTDSGRDVFSHACMTRSVISTREEGAAFDSVLQAQVQRILGVSGLLVMPVFSGPNLLGMLVAGGNSSQLDQLQSLHARIGLFLNKVASQLEVDARLLSEDPVLDEARLQEFQARARQLVHEANNPLGIVVNYLQILNRKFEQDPDTRKQIEILQEEVHRVSEILSSMRNLPQDVEQQRGATDLNALLKDLVSVFDVSLFKPRGINCILNMDERIGMIQSNSSHLKQIVTNLLKNAVEALEEKEKGTITVETEDGVYFDGQQCVRIVVADDGPGIAKDIKGQLFATAISSKGKPHSGIGLLVVKRLVSELGGKILVHSRAGKGARFELLFARE